MDFVVCQSGHDKYCYVITQDLLFGGRSYGASERFITCLGIRCTHGVITPDMSLISDAVIAGLPVYGPER